MFVLMFGLSSVRFGHRHWFSDQVAENVTTLKVNPEDGSTPRHLGQILMDKQNIRGGLQEIRATDDGFEFNISRLGTLHRIHYSRSRHEVRIRTEVLPFMTMMARMHHTFGLNHPYWPHNLWGGLMFMTSLALMILGVTGICLWCKLRSRQLIGSIVLLSSLALAIGLIIMVRIA